jgi:hypothetical protein
MLNNLRKKIKYAAAKETVKIFINKLSKNETMNKILTNIFGASWKTSLTAYVAAIFTACWPIIENGSFDIHKDWKNLVGAAFIALFGSNTKDKNVTGGTTQQ